MQPPADPLSIAFVGDPNSVHLRRWMGFFARRGHRVALLVPNRIGIDADLGADVEVLRFRALPARPDPLGIWRSRVELRARMRALDPAVVHAHYARAPAWHAWLAGRRPYAVTVWGSDVLRTGRMTAAGRWATRRALRDADLVTGAADHLAAAAVALGARPERVRIVQFGVDTETFSPAGDDRGLRRRLGLGDRPVLLSPRALGPLYRHETVLEAFAGLPSGDHQLLIATLNADPSYRAGLERLAAARGVADRVRFFPVLTGDEMAGLYRLSAAVVSVPESDGVPVTVLEGMACGVPVVASDLPGVREWLTGVSDELLVPVGDVVATRAALARALGLSEAQRRDLGGRLRARVEERANRTRNMMLMETWYRELAERRR